MQLRNALRLQESGKKPVVALVGAGGKSSLLFRLGEELAAAGQPTLLSATTRLWASQVDRVPFTLISASGPALASELPTSLRAYGRALAMAGTAGEPGKLAGLAPETICRLAALNDVAAVVVEADGSRERPLKAPASHEPVVPSCATHMVTVAGIAAIGQPLGASIVHRPEIAARLTGLQPGDVLTAQAVAVLLAHPEGGLKGCPPGATPLLFLNLSLDEAKGEVEARRRLEAAHQVAALVLALPAPAYRAVLIGSAQASAPVDEVHSRVAAVILAAGGSSRLTGDLPKQLLPWRAGATLAGHAADVALAAGALHEVVVVTGHRAQEVQAALGNRPVRCVFNPDWQAGQSSSVATGLKALGPQVSAALFILADQPTVQPRTIERLVVEHRRTLAPIVTPVYQRGQRGNPVLFDRCTFPELLALQGDTGGRPLIQRYGNLVAQVEIDEPAPQGIETVEDYERAAAQWMGRERNGARKNR